MNTWVDRLQTLIGRKPRVVERRESPRYKMEIEVQVTFNGRTHRGRTYDLGEDGISLYLAADLNERDEVWVSYQLGDGSPPKRVRGVIKNRAGARYGIAFQ